jgi:methanogenic corrinoid protein MtbC1
LLRVYRDGASERVIGQKYQISEFLHSKLIMASEAFKEGMNAFAMYLKPSKISPQSRIMIGTEGGQNDTGERETSWKGAISAATESP